MFPKPAFGSNTSGFGSFTSTPSTSFGAFKSPTGTGAFGGSSAFGASTSTQPTTGGGLFGASTSSGGLFGSTQAPAATSGFGASTGGFGFGANTPSGGLFSNNPSSGGLFGNTQNNSTFGAKPAGGFGFGGTTTNTSGLFGTSSTPGTGLFGQQNHTLGGGSLFSNTAGGFGQQTASGTGHVKYNPLVGTDVVVKSGTSQNINTKHHCITCMKEYEGKSLEELRLEDYTAGRKGSSGGMFGGFQQQTENKPLFGGSTFGQPATTSAPSMFGSGPLAASSGFGQPSTFSFGNTTQNPSTSASLFGANKTPFGTTTPATGLFGATTTQNPTFGTNTSTFGFGSNTQTQPGGLFAAKPATSAFGTTPSTGFGGFSTGTTLFGAKPQQTTAPTFGTATPGAFGGFGTNTSTASNPFGTSFGTTTVQPLQPNFGFGANKPTLGTGLGTGLGANTFQAKPPGSTSFGTLGSGLFAQTPAQNNTFKTGLDSGLGGGLFNNTSTLGATPLGGFNATNTGLNNSGTGVAGSSVHEQILTLAARPYGNSPLFKDLLPDSTTTAEEVLKPTNPGAVKGVLEASGAYRVTSTSGPRLKLMPRVAPMTTDKKSLFDGLEESDSTLEDRLSLKPSKKRLVLRTSNSKANDSAELNNNRRSLDATEVEVHHEEISNGRRTSDVAETGRQLAEASRNSDDYHHNSNSIENTSADYSTWLNVERERRNEKPIDDQTPRIYPSLDKEMAMSPVAERRASWLTTKPLRKPVASNTDATERIVRESNVGSERNVSFDNKENIDIAPVSEEEQVVGREVSVHPAGVKLSRPGYYTVPSLDEMIGYMRPDCSCVLPHLTIGRHNYGNVYFDEPIDVAGLDLDELVHFRNREVVVYPDESVKPPEGVGLNRRAIVTLDRVWPRDKTERRPITQPDRLMLMDFEGRLRRVCNKYETKFIEYRPQTGSWVFRVDHFSKYGFSDSDEEDDDVPDILKRQLVNQALQQAAPIKTALKPPAVATGSGLGGVGPGLGGSGALSELSALSTEDNVYTMHHTSLNLLNGGSKVFEMDTTEENAEIPSLYTETTGSIGVKSPTSELARLENRQSHNVQLMKASLYADTEMDDDMSASTGDQLVPQPSCLIMPAAATLTPSIQYNIQSEPMEDTPAVITEEIQMKALIVRPLTVVLNYHRKVPPFKQTIAGRMDAACLADMSVCRARHSRIGFGPAGALAFSTTYFSINELPKQAELPDLPLYVRGRSDTDWSEPVVAMIALGRHTRNNNITDTLKNYLAELLEYSESSAVRADALSVPRLSVKSSPLDRLRLLQKYVDLSADVKTTSAFGVSGVYWQQVWRLCEALWGADLKNDGVPGTDEESIVNRHKRLLEWLKDAVADVTDAELSQPVHTEKEDDKDGHSVRVWTLLLAGRVVEACKLSREMGDLNMATLIAQSHGDSIFRELIEHQLSKWRESGAIDLISSYKVAVLQLLAGSSIPPAQMSEVGWLRALSVAARYICPQVPSLEQIVRTYEGFFAKDLPPSDDALDLTAVEPDCASAPLPLPPHCKDYDCSIIAANNHRRILDLRYCLLRARAFNTRPRLQTGSYTPDPLDYTLCFLLGTWFGNPSVESVTGIADQLEANGDWHLAIQALAYHPDDKARNYLIQRLLSRLVPSRPSTAEMRSRLELVRRLAVPEKWIRRAQAHRAKYEHLPALEAEHLAAAGDWNAAHEVLLEHLLPQAVFNGTLFGNSVCATDNLKVISALLEQLNSAAERHEVSGWDKGGQALYRYMHICQEVCGVSEGGEARDALWPRVLAACRALAALQPRNPRVVVARAEMGSQLVELLMKAGTPPHQLAEMMRTLKLPLDATATARYKITAELAEQASELCIESAQSSPLSSRHRAIVGT